MPRQFIDMRCPDLLLAIAAKVAISQVVSEDEDDVGTGLGMAAGDCQQQEYACSCNDPMNALTEHAVYYGSFTACLASSLHCPFCFCHIRRMDSLTEPGL